MWFFAFILLSVILWVFFFFFGDCHVKHLDILFIFFVKIDLIWWDKFCCNFKYIFINEIVSLKKIVLIVGKINKKVGFYGVGWGGASRGPKGRGWGEKVFPVMRGGAGMGQDNTMRGGDEDPILQPCPASLPSLPP